MPKHINNHCSSAGFINSVSNHSVEELLFLFLNQILYLLHISNKPWDHSRLQRAWLILFLGIGLGIIINLRIFYLNCRLCNLFLFNSLYAFLISACSGQLLSIWFFWFDLIFVFSYSQIALSGTCLNTVWRRNHFFVDFPELILTFLRPLWFFFSCFILFLF